MRRAGVSRCCSSLECLDSSQKAKQKTTTSTSMAAAETPPTTHHSRRWSASDILDFRPDFLRVGALLDEEEAVSSSPIWSFVWAASFSHGMLSSSICGEEAVSAETDECVSSVAEDRSIRATMVGGSA